MQYIKDIIDILIKEHSPGTNKSKKDIKEMQYKAKEVLKRIKNKESTLYHAMKTITEITNWFNNIPTNK